MFAVEIRQPGQAWLVSLRGELDFSSAVRCGRRPAGRSWLDRYFHISRRGSTLAREVRGGVTTF
ncbi:hypothetical protein, partial [Streptomyces sp. NPDC001226]